MIGLWDFAWELVCDVVWELVWDVICDYVWELVHQFLFLSKANTTMGNKA